MKNNLSKTVVTAAILAGVALAQSPDGTTALSDRAAGRFLDQATWGPTPSAIAQLKQIGIAKWLYAQFAATPSDLPDQPELGADGKTNRDLMPVERAFFHNALAGDDQLRQRVAFALSQIWVVSVDSGVGDAYAYPHYWRIFRDNAFTNYRDIIKAVTLNPAMGRYLNMANNNKGNPKAGTAANENYARELLQLFTLGLVKLNPDGSPTTTPTYDQSVVTNLAKALTGWTYPTAPGATPKPNNPAYYAGQMFPVESNHDTSEKIIFDGQKLPAGQTAERDLEILLDALMANPTLAPFISQQLIEHLVTSNPSPYYIQRVSQVFSSTRGDMKAVLATILTDPEARAGDSGFVDRNFGHLREPILFMTGILRGLNATLGPATSVPSQAASMGEDLFHAPSVFSYFSPQYRTEKGLLGPEFQIYSTQTAATRADIVNTILYGKLDKDTTVDLSPFLKYAGGNTALLDYISSVFIDGSMSSDLHKAASDAINAATTPQRKVAGALYIVLTSGEYDIIH